MRTGPGENMIAGNNTIYIKSIRRTKPYTYLYIKNF